MAVPVNRSARWAAVAALSVAGLALAGCSGDGGDDGPTSAASTSSASPSASEAAGGDSGSPSTSPSGSPTGSYEPATSEGPAKNVPVPEMPEAVKEPTEEGLEAAVEYWWEAAFYLRQTGDSAPLEAISDPDCPLCQDQVVRWSEIYEDGAWVETGPAEIDFKFTKLDPDELGGTTAFSVSESPGELYDSNGDRVPDASGEGTIDTPWVAALNFDQADGKWLVEDLTAQGQNQ